MTKKDFNVKQQGFTLVELSIVLIIIGFIIAGVAAGQSMVKNAQLNSVIQDVNKYTSAYNNFKSRYLAVPGDFNKAGSIWPSCDATPSNCNGDMDGHISFAEGERAFQHLALAGMVDFSYSTTNPYPRTKFGGGTIWTLFNDGAQIYTVLPNTKNSLLWWVAPAPGDVEFISPVDAYSIDKKIDDGRPAAGRMLSEDLLVLGCIKAADGTTTVSATSYFLDDALYNLSEQNVTCNRVQFYLD